MMLDHVVDAHEKSFFELKKISQKKIYDLTWNRQIHSQRIEIEIWKVVELEKFSETDFSELEFGGSEFLISIFTFDSH